MAFAALTIDLNARLAKFEDDMSRVRRSMGGLEKSAGVLKAGLGGLFAGVGVAGLVAFAKNGIDAADALKDMSDRLGVSVKDLASFKLAAEQTGTDLEGLGKGIARLTRSIGEAEGGNAKLGEALKALGITARDPKEAFLQLADATEKIQDPSKRAALLAQVLGKSYQDLIPFLSQGGTELRRLAQESESFAQTMSRLAPDADKFNDELARLKQEAATAAGGILTQLVPALNKLFESYQNLNRLGKAGANFDDIFFGGVSGDIGKTIKTANEGIKSLESRIEFAKKLGKLGDTAPLEKELARVKSIRAEAQKISFEGAMKIAEGQYPKAPKKPLLDINLPTDKPKAGKASDPQGAFVAKLREEAATLGLTGEALQRYEALKLRLTGTNAKLADSYIAQISAFKSQQEAAKANNDAFDEAIKKQDDLDATLESSIKSLREWIVEQEYEVSLMGLSNDEREVAIRLRALETAGIDTQTEAYKKLAKQVADSQSKKRGASILSGTQTAKTKEFIADIKALDDLFFDGVIGATQYAEGIGMIAGNLQEVGKWQDGALKALQTYYSEAKDIAGQTEAVFTKALKGMEDALVSFVTTGKADFKSLALSIIADIVRIQAKQAIAGITQAIGGLFGGGVVPSAKGNVFNSPGLSAYSGSIVSKPTVFPFASGIGLMGEAGAEAILPLKRGKDGKLGVGTSGGGGVMVNVSVDATGSKVEGDQGKSGEFGRMIGNAVRGVLIQEMRPGGMLA